MDESQEQLLRAELEADEGRRNKIYKDSEGLDTVGIGHLVSNGFSDAVINLIFKEDINVAENFLNKNIPWWTSLSPVRQRVLLNMAFNLNARLLGFKNALFAAQAGQYKTSADEMLDSKWARQVGKRAKRLAYMMANDSLPPRTAEFY